VHIRRTPKGPQATDVQSPTWFCPPDVKASLLNHVIPVTFTKEDAEGEEELCRAALLFVALGEADAPISLPIVAVDNSCHRNGMCRVFRQRSRGIISEFELVLI
jgi:hypothetical protein